MTQIASLDRAQARAIPDLTALYREADRLELTPGWIKREQPILWHEPSSPFQPAHWRYGDVKKALDAAGDLVDVTLAERRNLVLRNPFPENNFATAKTLVCAYQMILPGEVAPTHRHSSHALRVILDGKGSYSVVDGEKTPMETGDVVLTPGNCWHGHGHDDTIAAALDRAKPDPDGMHGARIDLEAPDMPSMGLTMERLDSGGRTRRQRSTANRIFLAVEGSGETLIEGKRFAWQRGDTVVVPTWNRFEHRALADSVLFSLSDEPLMRFAKYYRVEAD
jgi:gentisate 1,2-dioxygenase